MIESENQRAEFATVEPTGYTFFQLAFRRKNVCLFGTGEAFAGNDDNATFVLQVSFLYKAENGLQRRRLHGNRANQAPLRREIRSA